MQRRDQAADGRGRNGHSGQTETQSVPLFAANSRKLKSCGGFIYFLRSKALSTEARSDFVSPDSRSAAARASKWK